MSSGLLSPHTVSDLLPYLSDEQVVLVGGQSVMFWAYYYGLINQNESFTTDIDFFGNSADIEAADARLVAIQHQTLFAELDDASPNSGVILVEYKGLKVRVDYLWSVYGLAGSDIIERSVPLNINGNTSTIRVLHPLMCLESKLANLGAFPNKRNAFGVTQAELTIKVAQRYIQNLLENQRLRDALNAIERVARIAQMDASNFAWLIFQLDVSLAIPPLNLLPTEFINLRLPQINERLFKARAALAKRLPPHPNVTNTMRLRF
jgi:hypothetical protein